jgi:hypothetical protein
MSPDRGESVNSSPPHRRRLGLNQFENQAEEGVVAGTAVDTRGTADELE